MMRKKAWCKTAQLVLNHLYDGCDLIVCIHPDELRYQRHYIHGGDHGYVWHKERGETIRTPPASVTGRLIADGFVVETQRVLASRQCYSPPFERGDGVCWEVTYRATREDEDFHVHAERNEECQKLFEALMVLQDHQEALQHLSLPSRITLQTIQKIEELKVLLKSKLAGSPITILNQEGA